MREMKNSGIDWIGLIPTDWTVMKLNNVASKITDFVASGSFADINENVQYLDYPDYAMLVRTADLSGTKDKRVYINQHAYEYLKNSNLFGGEIILSNIGSVGNVFMYEPLYERSSLAPNSILVDGCDCNKFVYYWFLNPLANNELKRIGGNAVQLKFNKTQLRQFKILCPPIDTQKRIVSYLDAKCSKIDSIIAKQEQIIEKLKEYKISIITEAVTRGLNPNAKMVESGVDWIGNIPETWRTIRIKWLLEERKERSESGEEEPLSMSQKYGIIPTKEMDRVPNLASSYVGAKIVYSDDLVFNKLKAHLGVFNVSKYDGLVSPDYAVYYSTGKVNLKYLEYVFKTPQCIMEFRKKSSGVADGLTRLYTDGLFSIYCPFPPREEQDKIANYLDKKISIIEKTICDREKTIEKFNMYKKSLIYEVVTGKKEV